MTPAATEQQGLIPGLRRPLGVLQLLVRLAEWIEATSAFTAPETESAPPDITP